MSELKIFESQLPTAIEDLSRFVLVGREKLKAVRAEIKALESIDFAADVRNQKVEEAQWINSAVLDAEKRIGELTLQMPKRMGGDRRSENFKRSSESTFENDAWYKDFDVNNEIAAAYREKAEREAEKPVTKTERLKELGFAKTQINEFEQMAQHPEILEQVKTEAVENGEIATRKDVLNKIKAEKREEKEQAREEKRMENAEKIEALSNPLEAQGLFQTIVIDPPWDWGDEGDVNQFGRAKPDYHTMPIEEIEQLPIARIADSDCHLYLWVTNRSLPKAFRLIEAWGFRYITCLTWVKPSIGMGNYFRGSTEHVLFAVKGSQPIRRKDIGTHFEAPRGEEHSAKPDIFYKIVQECSYGPYIDIFGRKERDGWTVWGENS